MRIVEFTLIIRHNPPARHHGGLTSHTSKDSSRPSFGESYKLLTCSIYIELIELFVIE